MHDDFIYQPPICPIEILYQDRDVVVVNKPSGLLSVPGRGLDKRDSMLTRIQQEHPTARIVHRLDMDTSGIMILALRKKAERNLREQFRLRNISKTYVALVQGGVQNSSGMIDQPIAPHPTLPLRHQVSPTGKEAQTKYRVLQAGEDCSLLALQPITGRSHQLRVHLQYLGHPILGDRFYAPAEVVQRADRLMLHAKELIFRQPYSNEELRVAVAEPFSIADRW